MTELFSMPQAGRKIARAKSQLKRDDTIRALESLLSGLEEFEPRSMPGKVRFEVEVLIQECILELNRQPVVRSLFEALAKSKTARVPYTPGQERKLVGVLTILHKALADSKAADEQGKQAALAQRRDTLLQKGEEYLKAGDGPRGKSALRVLAEEYGSEPGILLRAAELLLGSEIYFEAVEMLEQSIELFPKDGKAYGLATQTYLHLREFAKAEKIYLKAIKQFGKHPKTLLNLAKLYVSWNKKEEAFRTAQEAYSKDSSLDEAKAIIDKFA